MRIGGLGAAAGLSCVNSAPAGSSAGILIERVSSRFVAGSKSPTELAGDERDSEVLLSDASERLQMSISAPSRFSRPERRVCRHPSPAVAGFCTKDLLLNLFFPAHPSKIHSFVVVVAVVGFKVQDDSIRPSAGQGHPYLLHPFFLLRRCCK